MAETSIIARGLSKEYRIGERQERYDTMRDSITRGLKSLVTRDRSGVFSRERMWALRDVSFEIERGQVVGIIGRNGAGKTTLLRVLSRITEPTTGTAEVRGRLGSLLEVGTGFHPELTGRDNIFLNGAILGMRRREIARKFDAIVDFSGISTFIDTPVKRYSSGMYVRLAFSVAAHLEPDNLLVDEVLAVGDSEFQRRCLGRMEELGQEGRTVILVSHSMESVLRLCDRVIQMDGGRIVADGHPDDVVAHYLHPTEGSHAERVWDDGRGPGNDVARLRRARIADGAGTTSPALDMREPVVVEFEFDVANGGHPLCPMIAVNNDRGTLLFNALDPSPDRRNPVERGRYVARATIPANLLNEGWHSVTVFVNTLTSGKTEKHAVAQDAVSFQVVNRGTGLSAKGDLAQTWGGAVSPLLQWDLEPAR